MFNDKPNIPVVSGDRIYLLISNGKLVTSDTLRSLVRNNFTTQTIGQTTQKVYEAGLAHELISLWASQVEFGEFAIDSYVPPKYREQTKTILHSLGYFPIEMTWNNTAPLISIKEAKLKAALYNLNLNNEPSIHSKIHSKIYSKIKNMMNRTV